MASVAEGIESTRAEPPHSLASFIDRWIFVFMACLLVVTVLVGFIPTSIQKVADVQAGVRPAMPAVLHIHAVLMGSWMMLLLTQTVLMATGRSAFHKQLGMTGMVLAPSMVLTGIFLVPTMAGQAFAMLDAAPPDVLPPELVATTKGIISNVLAAQIVIGVLFSIFVGWGLMARKTDTGLHKRLMVLASALPIGAAVDRMSWLPTSLPDSPLSPTCYTIALIMPMLVWDLFRHRRLHRAYVAWFALYLPCMALVMYAWDKPWWIEFAQGVLGVSA